ncbi:MAG: AAA family ATPase, partial [Thermoplasmatota archaeon]
MIVALTGTPGVGKTTLAALLASPAGAGAVVVDLKAWAKKTGCVVGHDERDGSDVIDVDRLLEQELPDGDLVVVEGHL